MKMTPQEKRDTKMIVAIGVGIGLLVQPILLNNLEAFSLTSEIYVFILMVLISMLALAVARVVEYVWHGIYQFAKFGAVGVLNSFIDIGVFNLETFLYAMPVSTAFFAFFKALSFLCATTNSFFWNKTWTFSAHKKDNAKEVISFYVIAGLGWILNVGVATFVNSIGPAAGASNAHLWTNIVAPFAGIAVSFLWNFFGYKYFVFKK